MDKFVLDVNLSMTEENPTVKNIKSADLHETVSSYSLSSCSVGSDDVESIPDVTFNIVGSSNEGTIDSTGINRENQPLLSRDDTQPLNHIPGNILQCSPDEIIGSLARANATQQPLPL